MLSLADVLKEQETLVYGLGTIKLLASSSILREEIVSADVLSLVQNTLQVCCEVCSSTSSSSSASVQPSAGDMAHTRNILIQVRLFGKGSSTYKPTLMFVRSELVARVC